MADDVLRKDRVCATCDHSRKMPGELRCFYNPPTPCMVGMQPPPLTGQLPRPIIIGVVTPTWPNHTCCHWWERQPDHPDIGTTGTVIEHDLPQPHVPAPAREQ